jgi:uncharacterized protein (TIGR03067 family)
MNARWFYAKDKKKCGPVSSESLHALLSRGEIQPTDMVLQEGATRWVPASSLREARPTRLRGCAGAALNGLAEVPRAFGAAGAQALRALSYWGCKRRAAGLGQRARAAQLDLARALFNHQMGDPELRRQLGVVEESLRIIRASRGSAVRVQRERDELLLRLVEPWLHSATPPPGLGTEHRRALAAQQAWEQQQRTRAAKRAALFPSDRAGRARVWAGSGLLAASLIVGVVLLLPWGPGAERASGEVVAAAAPVSPANSDKAAPPVELLAKKADPPKKAGPPPLEPTPPPAKKSLKELYQLLSPAVPMVETPGAGGGSGFLIRHKDRYFVVTNRHVIAHARNGLEVYFLRSPRAGQEERLKVPSAKVKLVAVHRAVDLALIDLSAAAEELAAWKIQPLRMAAKDHVPAVGEHVFAIGHPGDAAGGVLTRTLSDGIVSAVNRKPGFNRVGYTQVTVPINPGNSGGPIFDDEGKVIAVATMTIRQDRQGNLPLEALNFGLDTRYVHELLDAPGKSLSQAEIAALLGVRETQPVGKVVFRRQASVLQTDGRVQVFVGNRMGHLHAKRYLVAMTRGARYRIDMVSDDFDAFLIVQDANGRQLAFDDDSGGGSRGLDARLTFIPPRDGTYNVYAAALVGTGKFTLTIRQGSDTADRVNEESTEPSRKLQGTWKAIKGQVGGKAIDIPESGPRKWVFSGNQWACSGKGAMVNGKQIPMEGTYTINASTSPRQITLFVKGDSTLPPMLGIYETDGNTLRIGFSERRRPNGFDDPMAVVVILERAKPTSSSGPAEDRNPP